MATTTRSSKIVEIAETHQVILQEKKLLRKTEEKTAEKLGE